MSGTSGDCGSGSGSDSGASSSSSSSSNSSNSSVTGPQVYDKGKAKAPEIRRNDSNEDGLDTNGHSENNRPGLGSDGVDSNIDFGFDLRPDVISSNRSLSAAAGSSSSGSGSSSFHRRAPSINTQRQAFTQINQLQYNQNRLVLAGAIQQATDLLNDLQQMNRVWPIYYPREAVEGPSSESASTNTNDSASSTANMTVLNGGANSSTNGTVNGSSDNSTSSQKDSKHQEISENGTGRSQNGNSINSSDNQGPRLVVPSASRQLQVFKLDLKLGSGSGSQELLNSLEKNSVASLLDAKIVQTLKHLASLRERINDTASKVLVTGDLNSGKSTFCNALLRRRILPEDQQPCTNVFCEVRDCRENDGLEQVHAVLIDREYDRNDEATYEIHGLDSLDDLVYEFQKYSILKVYVDEKRPPHESLLRNGVVDISLIDAPGLNMSSFQTTRVFSRQEEIDLVVFVVSAENHFTLSANEFISSVANEKSFIFIVVNQFDKIKDRSRCMNRILGQVEKLSPQTHKDARDFVHFVSSRDVGTSSGGGGGDDGPDGDDGDGGNGRDDDLSPDFDRLEESLRNFVLEKRSLSKLAPAKTYLNNILQDIEILSEVNIKFTKSERDLRLHELDDMTPKFEHALSDSVKVTEKIDKDIEHCAEKLYEHTKKELNRVLMQTGQLPSVSYTSIFDAYNYANSIRAAIIQRIQDAVYDCEVHARKETAIVVNSIKSLGILHLGEQPAFLKIFKEDAMFTKGRHNLARSIQAELSVSDFITAAAPTWVSVITNPFNSLLTLGEKSKELTLSEISEPISQVGTVNNALTVASVIGGGQMILQSKWLNHALNAVRWVDFQLLKRLLVPALVVGSVCGVAYVISEVPNSVPRNVSRKIAREVVSLGYVEANAKRIAKESRKVLKYPSQDVRTGFQRLIENTAHQREACEKSAKEAQAGYEYFVKLHTDAAHQRALIDQCNLETHLEVD
ncbi:mitofusin [Sugiyamaella lignohabitans]|uniref:Mitofusin n=1 Tax=Sugiyamaella lignohabitans TaxID=796027 RepID=A0A167DG68_9ASCO|nr:mitofusin [Sugiyamaella lignohabitans]ANB12880.1 mitofusin [Sugiyamaella lignohabitans]